MGTDAWLPLAAAPDSRSELQCAAAGARAGWSRQVTVVHGRRA